MIYLLIAKVNRASLSVRDTYNQLLHNNDFLTNEYKESYNASNLSNCSYSISFNYNHVDNKIRDEMLMVLSYSNITKQSSTSATFNR